MRILSTLDASPKQSLYYVTEDRERLKLTFYFLPTQASWFIDVESDTFKLSGTRLCAHPNLMTKYHNIIKWGLSVTTIDGFDPYRIDDFTSGRCEIGMLNRAEVREIEGFLNGKTK